MRKAYLSMPADTPKSIRDNLIKHLTNKCDIDEVTYWIKGTYYSDIDLLEADFVYSYVPEFAWHDDNDVYVYMGKGQFSEYHKIDDYKFSIIDSKGNLFHAEHSVPHDYNDWKRKYGKVWVTPMNTAQTISKKILLLLASRRKN